MSLRRTGLNHLRMVRPGSLPPWHRKNLFWNLQHFVGLPLLSAGSIAAIPQKGMIPPSVARWTMGKRSVLRPQDTHHIAKDLDRTP